MKRRGRDPFLPRRGRTGSWRAVRRVVAAATAAIGSMATDGAAQEDFRHVDEGRPTRVEDAYPLKFLELEWQLGALGAIAEGDRKQAEGVFELKLGAAPNLQVGIESHAGWERSVGGDATGIESFGAHVLYNVNQEGRRSPAVALRSDLYLPGTGDLGRMAAGGRVKGMATRSLGVSRVHLNVARAWADDRDGGAAWSAGLAWDHALGLSGRALVADVFIEAPDGGDTSIWVDGGIRMQVSKQSVLDVGLATRIDQWVDGEANVGLVVGVSRAFGLSGLTRVPPYPEPALR